MRALRGRIVLLLVALLVILQLGSMAAHETYNGPGPLLVSSDLVIPSGGTKAVAAALRRDDAIRSKLAFRIAAWATRRDGPIHAGEFLFPARASLADILHILRHGVPVEHQVTIPEGLTGAQIESLSVTELQGLSPVQIMSFTSGQLTAMNDAQFSAILG